MLTVILLEILRLSHSPFQDSWGKAASPEHLDFADLLFNQLNDLQLLRFASLYNAILTQSNFVFVSDTLKNDNFY